MSDLHVVLVRLVLVLWAGLVIVGGGILALTGEKVLPNFPIKWQVMAFSVLPLVLYAGFWNSIMIGMGQIWVLNGVQLVISACQLLLILVFIVALSGGILSAIVIYVATMLIQCASMVAIIIRLGMRRRDQAPLTELARQMVSFGLRGYGGSIATMLWMRVPVFLLNMYHGPVAVGVFSVAQQLSEKVLLPVQAIQDAIYRKISTLDPDGAAATMNRYLRIGSTGMILLVMVGMVAAPWGIIVLFGDAYSGAANVFRIFLLGTIFISAAMILSTYLLSHQERPGLLSILAGVNAVVCSLLSCLFIPAWGELGAASAVALTQLVGTVIVFTLYLSIASTSPRKALVLCGEDVALMVNQASAMLCRKQLKV